MISERSIFYESSCSKRIIQWYFFKFAQQKILWSIRMQYRTCSEIRSIQAENDIKLGRIQEAESAFADIVNELNDYDVNTENKFQAEN